MLCHPLRDYPADSGAEALTARDLLHRPVGLVNRAVCVRVSSGIGVGDGQTAKRFARNFARSLSSLEPEFVPKRAVFVGVSMRPAVHRNRGNVAGGVESSSA